MRFLHKVTSHSVRCWQGDVTGCALALVLTSPLDYESRAAYQLLVQVQDPDMMQATLEVTVSVTDVNEPPQVCVSDLSRSDMTASHYMYVRCVMFLNVSQPLQVCQICYVLTCQPTTTGMSDMFLHVSQPLRVCQICHVLKCQPATTGMSDMLCSYMSANHYKYVRLALRC